MNETITRDQLEKALWEWSGFHADAASTAGLMVVIDAYAATLAKDLNAAPSGVIAAYLHTLTLQAELLLDTGGRVHLAPAPEVPPEPVKAVPKEPARSGQPGTYFNEDGTITCRVCGIAKQPDDFHRDAAKRTGHKSRCRTCSVGA